MMVSVIRRRKGGRFYYYLKHTSTSGQRETYLGRNIPENVGELKEGFMLEFYRQEWLPKLDAISSRYGEEMGRMPKDVRGDIMDNFCADFAYNTQRIEGSTMTLRETENLLLHGIPPRGRPENERHEAEMQRSILRKILDGGQDVTMETVLAWHETIFLWTSHADAGSLRRYAVEVRGSKVEFPLWYDVPEELDRFFAWYAKAKGGMNPVELAAMAHYRFVSIHPFGDGNGRISRLIMNCILHNGGYPMFTVRVRDRLSYVKSLERSNLAGNAALFIRWFMRRYIDANSRYLNVPRGSRGWTDDRLP